MYVCVCVYVCGIKNVGVFFYSIAELVLGDGKYVVPAVDVGLISEKLSGLVVALLPPEVVSSTEIRLVWEIRRSHQYISGIRIKYRQVVVCAP